MARMESRINLPHQFPNRRAGVENLDRALSFVFVIDILIHADPRGRAEPHGGEAHWQAKDLDADDPDDVAKMV